MSGPCDPSLGLGGERERGPVGRVGRVRVDDLESVGDLDGLGRREAGRRGRVSVGADEAVVSGVGVGSAEVDGVSVGAAEDGSSLPVTVAVAVAVGDAVAGGGLTDGLAVGGWLDPAPGAWVGTRIATTDEPPASEPIDDEWLAVGSEDGIRAGNRTDRLGVLVGQVLHAVGRGARTDLVDPRPNDLGLAVLVDAQVRDVLRRDRERRRRGGAGRRGAEGDRRRLGSAGRGRDAAEGPLGGGQCPNGDRHDQRAGEKGEGPEGRASRATPGARSMT